MKKSIAIDMDDTVADTLARHIEWYSKAFLGSLKKQNTLGYKIYDIVPEKHLATVRNFPRHSDFFKDLAIFDDAIKVIKALSQKYDVYFASAAMEYPSSFSAKYDWLSQHFPFIDPLNYIFCGHKHMLNCDHLIDYSPRHLDKFKGKGLLFSAEHNVHDDKHQRVHNWKEIADLLL